MYTPHEPADSAGSPAPPDREQEERRTVRLALPRPLMMILLVVLAVFALSIVPPILDNPFQVASDAVAAAGAWAPEDVRFVHGTYRIRWLACRVEASLIVSTPTGERFVEVEMVHLPIAGWSTRRLGFLEVWSA